MLMDLLIDNEFFCIRLYENIAYVKVKGMPDEKAAVFFTQIIDEMLNGYPYEDFVSVCDVTDLILSEPKVAIMMNKAIRKISENLNYKYNVFIVKPRFLRIIKAFIFFFYFKNINIKIRMFEQEDMALKWLEGKGYSLGKIKEFLTLENEKKLNPV